MSIVPPRADTPPDPPGPFFVCPSCGALDRSASVRVNHLEVNVADCICPNDHLWTVRWVGAA